MTKLLYFLGGAAFAIGLAFAWVSFGFAADQLDETAVASWGDEEPQEPLPAADAADTAALGADGTTTVYFAPQDSNGTGTIVFLYNTGLISRTVPIRGYDSVGGIVVSETVTIAPHNMIPLVSDSLIGSPPPGWANSVLTNYTDLTTYAILALPEGVKIDGYVVFNPTTGTIDPRADQGALPLRFSTDPLAIFLPTVRSAP